MRGRLILRYSRIALNKNILGDKGMSIIKYLKSSSKRKKNSRTDLQEKNIVGKCDNCITFQNYSVMVF